jgi:hypothetical protein
MTTFTVPARCQRVFDLLAAVYPRKLRIKDIIERTGHPCDERKLRELREANPGLIAQEWHTRDGRGWYEYGLALNVTDTLLMMPL